MRVEIDQYGTMTIIPEGGSEGYALRKWWEDWQASRVVLSVRVDCDNGVTREEIIRPTPPAPEGGGR